MALLNRPTTGLILFCIYIAITTGCGGPPGASKPSSPAPAAPVTRNVKDSGPLADADLTKARALFDAKCATCHTKTGVGDHHHKKDGIPSFADAAWQQRTGDDEIVSAITVTCATDGNHGRSVAWGARMFGCACVIYIHETVSAARKAAIEGYGATVVRTPGTYDDSVRQAAADADRLGRFVVSDTSYEGYEDVPRDVMQGYAVMAEEALGQWAGAPPTHLFVQAGVGGLAAAVGGHLWERLGPARPRLVVVEPEKAACLYLSARAGKPTVAEGALDTIMAGLACGEVSLLAWRILEAGADAFMTVPDSAAIRAMRLLADGTPPVVAGESAVGGLAGLLAGAADPASRAALGLDATSRVLLFGSEGDTDPALYAELVGRTAAAVRAAA